MKIKPIIILIVWLMSSIPAYADYYEPVPHCYQPAQPLWLASFNYKQRYKSEVEQYHTCIKAFIIKQKKAIEMHNHAAQNALQIWNDFIDKN